MQHRMKEFSMTPEATLALLGRGQVGVLSTSGADGAPYGVPVHYLWQDGKLWFHGLPAGEKALVRAFLLREQEDRRPPRP